MSCIKFIHGPQLKLVSGIIYHLHTHLHICFGITIMLYNTRLTITSIYHSVHYAVSTAFWVCLHKIIN